MKSKGMIVLFVFLFCMIIIPAQEFGDVQQCSEYTDAGLTLSVSHPITSKIGGNVTITIIVYDSNGKVKTSADTTCTIGLGDSQGAGAYFINSTDITILPAPTNAWMGIFPSFLFTETSNFAFIARCETTNAGGCFEAHFQTTASGIPLSIYDSLVRMFLIIFFIVLLAGTYHVVAGIDFKRWNDRIIEKYKTRNFVKMVLSALAYNIMNNIFIIYYLIGLPIIMILTDLTRVYNIAGMILFMDVVLFVYLIGVLIVGLVFFSYVQEWIMITWDLVSDINWGIE